MKSSHVSVTAGKIRPVDLIDRNVLLQIFEGIVDIYFKLFYRF